MKKLLRVVIAALVLGGLGFAGYYFLFGTPTKRTCRHLAELCGSSKRFGDLEQCEKIFATFERTSGAESVARARSCILESNSCVAAGGCMVRIGLGAAGQLLDGLKRSIAPAN